MTRLKIEAWNKKGTITGFFKKTEWRQNFLQVMWNELNISEHCDDFF